MPRIIEVIVSPTGETTIHTEGYTGSTCLLASKFLKQTLGVIAAEAKTSEFYQAQQHQQEIQQ